MQKKIFSIIFLLGYSVFLSQVVIIREIFVVFYGNELMLGIIFFFWLTGTGAGSLISKKLMINSRDLPEVFVICQILLFLILFIIVFLLKSSMILFKPQQGEIIGLGAMIVNSFIFITPFCLLAGFLFPLACRILNNFINEPVSSTGYTYMLEASGAVVAGLTGNLILIRFLPAWHIIFIIGAVLLLNCLLIYIFIFKEFNAILAFIFSCFSLSLFYTPIYRYLDEANGKLRWQEYRILASESSIYGQITVLQKEDNISFYNNGLYDFTYPDQLSAEDIHLTALQNTGAKNALVIGGGLNGSLAELLKHENIGEIIYVELDPLIIDLAIKLLPEDAVPFYDQRVSIVNTDGRAFIKNTRKKFGLVIMNLPEPYTGSINRFYTLEFFGEVLETLTPDGVFSLTLPSGENYISPEQKRLLSSTYHTLLNIFPEVSIIPGGTNIFLSSRIKGQITLDGVILGERLKTAKIELLFLSPYQIPFRLSRERIDQLKLKLSPPQPLNKDFSPVNYFYDLLLWASRISDRSVKFVSMLEHVFTIENILGAVFTLGVFLLLLSKVKKTDFVPLAIASAGFTGISLELIISLIFQIKTGYLYFQLGVIIASFMLGLACGSYFMTKSIKNIQRADTAFNYIYSALAFYPFFIIMLFYFLFKNTLNINILAFLAVLFMPSFIIGGLFSLANGISRYKNDGGASFGRFYSYDLFGAAFGSLLTTAVFIPLLGIYSTLLVVASVNLVVLSLNLVKSE